MMQLRFGLPLIFSVISLTGCNSLAWNNGTLDYKKTTTIEALKYPEGTMVRSATPLYPAPIVDELAIENAPKFENSKGTRFQLNRVEVNTGINLDSTSQKQINRPKKSVDRNQNPMLNIDGQAIIVWQYTLATLSSLNYKVLSQSPHKYEAAVQIDGKVYLLRLLPVGNSNHLVVFNPDNSYADQQVSADLLAQVYQNWPA